MSKERMTVCLEDFLKYLLKKWKVIVPITILCTVAFLAAALKAGEVITMPPSEEYLYLLAQKEAMDEYMENSVIMNVDAQNVCKVSIAVENISDREALKEYVLSEEIWEDAATEVSVEYLKELFVWSNGVSEAEVEIKIRHYDENLCKEYAEYIAEQVVNYDANLKVIVAPMEVGSDDAALMTQLTKFDLEHKIDSNLEISAAGYTIHISKVAAAGAGVFFGALLSVVILFFKYLLKDQWK